MKVAFFSTHDFDRQYFDEYNIYNYKYTYLECSIDEDTIELAKNHDVVCGFANDKIDNNVILKIADLNIKLIALRCKGLDNIDIEFARLKGITVIRVAEYSPHAVAEHALAMLLTLNRKVHKAYNRVRESDFSLSNLLGFDLYQKTVGVVGAGRIGSTFAKIMYGLGCRVIINDPIKNNALVHLDVQWVDYETLLVESDIISLHCPLNENTFYMVSDESIKMMKTGVFLINTGRGALIDTNAVKNGLLTGKIGYLALDVYENEEKIFFHNLSNTIVHDHLLLELLMYPNVLITAHQAFLTKEALTTIAQTTIQNINIFFSGGSGS